MDSIQITNTATNTIPNILLQMKNDNKSNYTIKFTRKALSFLSKHTTLNEPEAVRAFLASLNASEGYKKNLCIAYNRYCKYNKIEWTMPKYNPVSKVIKIPSKDKLEMFIAKAGNTLGTKLQLSMETGLRPIEAYNLKVKDIDLEQRLIYPTTAKHGSPRALKISNSLTKMLTDHIARNHLSLTDKIFKGTPDDYGKSFRTMRNKLANKLHDPTLSQIRLYDFRHYFATTLYAKTRDILLVMKQMGHKKIQTTLIYTQLLNLNEDEWTCKATNNSKDTTALVERGFEYFAPTPD